MIEAEDLEQINRFARAQLKEENVYAFRVTLCDNDIDRDNERFSPEALEALAGLFVGKTGIYDHNPKGRNQWARIYKTQVVRDSARLTVDGLPYVYLQGSAYMVRTASNEDLILEIEGGIKKEVSIGCRVEQKICSICGVNRNKEPCAHVVGKHYGGALCFASLEHPSDAYEFSFVAVPAQKQAGITKAYGCAQKAGVDGISKLFAGGAVTLEEGEAAEVCGCIEKWKALSGLGEQFLQRERRELLRAATLCGFEMDRRHLGEMAEHLPLEQLCALKQAIEKLAEKGHGLKTQLSPSPPSSSKENLTAFRIGTGGGLATEL